MMASDRATGYQQPPLVERAIQMPVYVELERRTRPSLVVSKLQRYAGFYLRVLNDDRWCVVRPVLVVHHDPRSDHRRGERQLGAGAHHLSMRLTDELTTATGDGAHYGTFNDRLQRMDRSLDLGRLILVTDWTDLRAHGLGAYGYTLAHFAGVDGDGNRTDERVYDVQLDTVAHEWSRQVGIIGNHLGGNGHPKRQNPGKLPRPCAYQREQDGFGGRATKLSWSITTEPWAWRGLLRIPPQKPYRGTPPRGSLPRSIERETPSSTVYVGYDEPAQVHGLALVCAKGTRANA